MDQAFDPIGKQLISMRVLPLMHQKAHLDLRYVAAVACSPITRTVSDTFSPASHVPLYSTVKASQQGEGFQVSHSLMSLCPEDKTCKGL